MTLLHLVLMLTADLKRTLLQPNFLFHVSQVQLMRIFLKNQDLAMETPMII